MNPKDEALRLLSLAAAEIQKLNPQPESAPGPLESEQGRAYQALNAVNQAIEWLKPPTD
jgi:hypothetical protein